MSHDIGAVRFSDGKIMFFEYNGTVDVAIGKLYETVDEVHENWRSDVFGKCLCGKDEPVELATQYGGMRWAGRSCRHCGTITGGWNPFGELDEVDDHPFCPPSKENKGISLCFELPEWWPAV